MEAVKKKQTRDSARTGKLMLQAARAEFAKAGFEGARVDKIAERSGMSKGLIYHHFGSKDDLFIAVLEDIYSELRAENEELILDELEPLDAIKALISHTFMYFANNPEFIVLVHSENLMSAEHLGKSASVNNLFEPLSEKLDELLKRGAEQGIFRAGVDTKQLYISIAALGYFFLSNRHSLSVVFNIDLFAEKSIEERLAHIEEVVLGYLRPTDQLS